MRWVRLGVWTPEPILDRSSLCLHVQTSQADLFSFKQKEYPTPFSGDVSTAPNRQVPNSSPVLPSELQCSTYQPIPISWPPLLQAPLLHPHHLPPLLPPRPPHQNPHHKSTYIPTAPTEIQTTRTRMIMRVYRLVRVGG